MKKIVLGLLFTLLTINIYSQDISWDFYVGTWEYKNLATGEEFMMKLKKSLAKIQKAFGGGTETCLIGAYIYKKNGVILINCMSQFDEVKKDGMNYPVCITGIPGSSLNIFDFKINDYMITNPNGEEKVIGFPSKVHLHSIFPKQIRIELVPDGMERVYLDEKDVFPVGTSLPGNMILIKVE